MIEMLMSSTLWGHAAMSLLRVAEGLFLSLAIGVALGLLLAASAKANKWFSPLLYFVYPIPKLALLPLIMLTMGIGESAKITMIVLILVFQIIVATRDAVLHIPKEDFEVFTSLGARRSYQFRWIILPAMLPEVLTSVRVAVGTAISVLFFTETYGTTKGLGFYIVDAWMRLSYPEMTIGIIVMSLMGVGLFILIDWAEKLACRWKKN